MIQDIRKLSNLIKNILPQRWLLIGEVITSLLMTLAEGASIGIIYVFLG